MRVFSCVLLLAATAFGQTASQRIPSDDAVRIGEFYRLSAEVQDRIWPNWSHVPAPLLLITPEMEYLTHDSVRPAGFKDVGDGFSARPRQFSINLLATLPAFGPPSVIVIGEPSNTSSKTSAPWLITVMHEHFHQLQNAQPGYFDAVAALGLADGDKTGMWMLNYPFPYEKASVIASFDRLRALLLGAVKETDVAKFTSAAKQYVRERNKFMAELSANDRKYLEFQLWQEGIARYTQIKVAEAAAKYQPTAEYTALPDFEPFSKFSGAAEETLDELKQANLQQWKRTVVYSFGAAEGLLLDRLHPNWKDEYFKHPLTMQHFFEQ
jgi:hypothetical protein